MSDDLVEQSLVVVKLYGEFSHHVELKARIIDVCETLGLMPGVDFDIVAGFVDDPKLSPPTEAASSKQLWFLNKCLQDARRYESKSDLLPTTVVIALAELRAPISKQRASQLIDALKEQTDEARDA